ncbi:hypothetical protein KXR53_14425 [Inquilinus limosus]|uniref:calcium-binding protein n=1 Tax=Inquilinus limosus TaxID=171674 RepID=UPI003F173B5C
MRRIRIAKRGEAGIKLVWAREGRENTGRGAPILVGENFMPVFSGTAAADRIVGSAEADQIYGLDGNDILYGVDGNDWLVGGLGADIMVGGLGDDSYDVDSAGDQVVERAGEGIDRVRASISHQLAANIEILTLSGTADINGFGNALDNTILGNAGNNVLNGGAGNDAMAGGAGNDTYDVDSTEDVVSEGANAGYDRVRASANYILGANVEELVMVGTGDIGGLGNSLDNTLIGNSGANAFSGLGGNDWISGGAGDDSISGGAGLDQIFGGSGGDYFIVRSGDLVAGERYDGGDGDDGLELRRSSGSTSIDLSGVNITGIERLFAAGGYTQVSLTAGQADSLKVVSFEGLNNPSILQVTNGGLIDLSDATQLAVQTLRLSDSGNTLILPGTGFNLPEVQGGAGADVVQGGPLSSEIHGNGGDDDLRGDAGFDLLEGGAGDDRLTGGAGDDWLVGGAGADQFIYHAGANGLDHVSDFIASAGEDKLVFEDLLHGTFSYRGAAAFTAGGNSEARFSGEDVLVDTDGNGTVDITIYLTGMTTASQLQASDFVFS